MGSFCFFSLSAKSFLPPSTKPSSPWPSSRSSMSWSISEWTWATPRVFAQLLSLPDQQLNPSNFALHPNCLHHHHYLPLPHRQSEKNITRIAKEGHPLFVVVLFGGAGGSYSLHYTTISATHMIPIIVVIDVFIKLQWVKTKWFDPQPIFCWDWCVVAVSQSAEHCSLSGIKGILHSVTCTIPMKYDQIVHHHTTTKYCWICPRLSSANN